MKSVGQVLRETRESKGLSTKQVSNAIKIRESLIDALENADYYAFSSDMHLKSFLKSYANYLDINEEKIMALYRRERQIQDPEADKSKGRDNFNGRMSFIISKVINVKSLLSLLALALLAAVPYFFYRQWTAFNQPPVLEIRTPKQDEIVSTESFVIEGFTGDPSVKVILDGNEANYVDSNGNFKINAKFTEPGLKRFQLVAKNQFNKSKEASLELTYKPPQKVESKPKLRFTNKSAAVYNLTILRDKSTTTETIPVKPATTAEVLVNNSITVKNFDKSVLDLYFNDDQNPTTSIDSKEFSIIIENNRPIINTKQDEPKKQ